MTSIQTTNDPPPRRLAFDEDIFCPQCGYNLRGVESDRCPECGREFDRAALRVSAIPWVHRREIGWFRAYWRTAWFVTARTKRFAEELSRPTPYRDSQLFRWVTILVVCLPVAPAIAAVYALASRPLLGDPVVDEILMMVWPVAAVGVALIMALAAATGLPSYSFHPQGVPIEMQNRAVALSYYACAPFGLTLPLGGMAIAGLGLVLSVNSWDRAPFTLQFTASMLLVLGIGGILLEPFFWWLAVWRLARRAFQHSHPGRLLWIAALPIVWPAAIVLIVGGISLVVGFVALVVDSLR